MITVNEQRVPLPQNSVLPLNESNYVILGILGYGGSCIAYSAQRTPNEYELSIGMPPIPAVIKEFYPVELSATIKRNDDAIFVTEAGQKQFNWLRKRFERGMVNQAHFFVKDSDHSFAPTRIAVTNNTVYSIIDSVQGDILENIRTKLNMYEIAQVIQSLCYAVKELHDDRKLHLDVKPSNIFLFNKDSCESRRIALFDFDTVTSVDEIGTAVIPFSEGWSPYEQVNQQREKISFATDIYAIGAVSYWLLSGNKVDDTLLNDIKRQRFDFLDGLAVLANKQSPRSDLKVLLSDTLKREPTERVQNLEGLLE